MWAIWISFTISSSSDTIVPEPGGVKGMGKAGQALRQVLDLYNISQNQLAIALGVERGIVGRWVHGRRGLTSDTVVDVVRALQSIHPGAAKEFVQLYLVNELEGPAAKSAAQPHLWTIDEYHRMMETGILTSADRVELLEGQIIQMPPQSALHADTVQHIGAYLQDLLSGQADVRIQLPLTLSDSEPKPDVAIARINPSGDGDRSSSNEVVWLIEVADVTLEIDRGWKAKIYAKSMVIDYWVVDINHRQVYVFREAEDEKYQSKMFYNDRSICISLEFPEIEVALINLFC